MYVRSSIAENLNTPITILNNFSEYPERSVHESVTKNYNIPRDLLAILAEDNDSFVILGALNIITINLFFNKFFTHNKIVIV
jgi:hypothetical protein